MAFYKSSYILVTIFVLLHCVQAIFNSTFPNVTFRELTDSEIQLLTDNFTLVTADAPKLAATNKTDCFCGTSNTPRFVGGVEAYDSEFPWMVYLTIKKDAKVYFCAGFLITNKHVLTAASCTKNSNKEGVTIYLGNNNQNATFETPAIKVLAKSILIHPQYNKPQIFNNDIAIIRLKYAISFTENIRPICMPPKKFKFDFTNAMTTVAGWGGASKLSGHVLRKATGSILSNEDCQSLYKSTVPDLKITSRMMCVGKEGNDTCYEDEGGPLMISHNSRYYAVGIVSLNFVCESPAVFARLIKYRNFINRYTTDGTTCK